MCDHTVALRWMTRIRGPRLIEKPGFFWRGANITGVPRGDDHCLISAVAATGK